MGRAARNVNGKAILYADVMTDSMRQRHRRNQPPAPQSRPQYNEENNITPQSIIKPIDMSLVAMAEGDYVTVPLEAEDEEVDVDDAPEERARFLAELEERMREAARKFEFEKAAALRDRLKALKAMAL